jgi:hypothetical protein
MAISWKSRSAWRSTPTPRPPASMTDVVWLGICVLKAINGLKSPALAHPVFPILPKDNVEVSQKRRSRIERCRSPVA